MAPDRTASAPPALVLSRRPGRGSLYRPEIDGLRAVAVLAVILHHFSERLLPGGYLGVDVFFVISGYVITASLAHRPAGSLADLMLGFYGRRIRRLLPALLLCVLITGLLLSLVAPDPGQMLGVGWRSLFGFANITLYHLAVEYFRPAIALEPFAHTWSLGVEEQFYLVFPLLLWFTGFARGEAEGAKRLLWLLLALALGSLLILLRWLAVDQPAAYYLLPARFWEIAAGAVLFLLLRPRGSAGDRAPAWELPPLPALLGLLAVMALPLPFGALPLLGAVAFTVLLIGSLRPGTGAHRLLSSPPLVFLGLISYSLYLWHWSVLSLSRWSVGVTPFTALWQVPLILVLAVLSWRCLEEPLRRSQWWPERWKVLASGVLLAVLGAAGLQALTRFGAARLYAGDRDAGFRDPALAPPPSRDAVASAEAPDRRAAAARTPSAFSPPDCSRPGQGRLLFAGDSHAHHYMAAAQALCRRHGLAYSEAATIAAPYPPLHYTNPATGIDQESSRRYGQVAEQRFLQMMHTPAPPQGAEGVVVLSLRSPLYFDSGHIGHAVLGRTGHFDPLTGVAVPRSQALQAWIRAVDALAGRYPETRFVVMLPTPEFGGEVPMELCRPQWFRPAPAEPCRDGQPRAPLDRFSASFGGELRRGLANRPNVRIHNPADSLCGAQRCARLRDGGLLYSDGDHLTGYGAALVLDGLVADLRRKGWLPTTPVAAPAADPGSAAGPAARSASPASPAADPGGATTMP